MHREINQEGLDLIKSFEGLRFSSYDDGVGVWTIGYGHTKNICPEMTIDKEQAELFLKQDLKRFEAAVSRLVKVHLTDNQFSALVAFAFNVGDGALAKSTLLELLNQAQYDLAADQFLRWDKAQGKVLAGLTRRRKAEQALFLKK
jgi:GH24 family phage-related lysozyme (muramidase)